MGRNGAPCPRSSGHGGFGHGLGPKAGGSHAVREHLWARLQAWRAVATRDDKTAASFLGLLCLAATAGWLRRSPPLVLQRTTTDLMITPVPAPIAFLSALSALLPRAVTEVAAGGLGVPRNPVEVEA